jgi:hypothetical protein
VSPTACWNGASGESKGLRRYDNENLLWQFTVAIKSCWLERLLIKEMSDDSLRDGLGTNHCVSSCHGRLLAASFRLDRLWHMWRGSALRQEKQGTWGCVVGSGGDVVCGCDGCFRAVKYFLVRSSTFAIDFRRESCYNSRVMSIL